MIIVDVIKALSFSLRARKETGGRPSGLFLFADNFKRNLIDSEPSAATLSLEYVMEGGELLKDAVRARIPLIAAQIEDTVYAAQILEDLCGEKVANMSSSIREGGLYFHLSRAGKGLDNAPVAYEAFQASGATLIYLNQTNPPDEYLNVGLIQPTSQFLKKQLQAVVTVEQMAVVLPALGGLSVKDSITVVRVAKTRHKTITAEAIVETRRQLIRTSQGLTLIDPYLPAYKPDPKMVAFATKEKKWFLSNSDSRLRPRGLLFDGPAGTGKTLSAKYLANVWGIPLFRLDATFQGKYVGQSEGAVSSALRKVEAAEPCVFLLDEIEKFFSGASSGDSSSAGVMVRVMGELLWWLQEHSSRVLTIMTTNNRRAIPPELYREGRIDAVYTFERLVDSAEIADVAHVVWQSFQGDAETGPDFDNLLEIMEATANVKTNGQPTGISPAKITQLVKSFIKAKETKQ